MVGHCARGVVSLVNNGPHSNQCEFLVTLKEMRFFDGKYVAIGRVVDSETTLQTIEGVATEFERPVVDIEVCAVEVGRVPLF